MRHAGLDQERLSPPVFTRSGRLRMDRDRKAVFNSKLMLEDIVAFAKRLDSSHDGDNERPPSIAFHFDCADCVKPIMR